MKRIPELKAAYAAMTPQARGLLLDFAKGLSERMPRAQRAAVDQSNPATPGRGRATSRA